MSFLFLFFLIIFFLQLAFLVLVNIIHWKGAKWFNIETADRTYLPESWEYYYLFLRKQKTENTISVTKNKIILWSLIASCYEKMKTTNKQSKQTFLHNRQAS